MRGRHGEIYAVAETPTPPPPAAPLLRYHWAHHYGGALIYDRTTWKFVLVQPGDEMVAFLAEVEAAHDEQDVLKEYLEART